MLKFLAIGDPHFKINNVEHSKEFTTEVLNYIKLHDELDFIIVLGDVHDKHQFLHSQILHDVSVFFNDISKLKPLYVLVGNHDRINNSDFLSDIHPFVDMLDNPNIKIAYKVLDVNIKNFRLLMVPYVPPGKFMDALNTVENPLNCDCIFAHQEFYGCKMGAIISSKGDKWNDEYPYVITGHIHDYQKIGKNITYVGTPMQHAYGDNTLKTISLFTLSKDTKDDNNINDLSTSLEKLNLNNDKEADITCELIAANAPTLFAATLFEERVELNIKKREIVRINANKIDLFIPNPNKLQKLIIIGTQGQISIIKTLPKYKDLLEKVNKIDFDYIMDESENIKNNTSDIYTYVSNDNYLTKLKEKIETDERKTKIFKQIFE